MRNLQQSGNIYESSVTGIKKASPNSSGNKIADISNIEIGSINSHNQFGIYGTYNYDISNRKAMDTASKFTVDNISHCFDIMIKYFNLFFKSHAAWN
ncbi:hypothetical protein LI094_02580 [[Clostridium] saccharogumia]|uniref:SpoIVB peptidase S55 domain-containing protein n=1 Tax=Thomasclavelia saccharogumia TaxID=341225 RepID=UPI001D078093|nr:hypothetical protein [Thomasclavelia saccharogumia]